MVKAIYLEGWVKSDVVGPIHTGGTHVDDLEVGDIELTRWPHIGQTDSIRIVGKVDQPQARGGGQGK